MPSHHLLASRPSGPRQQHVGLALHIAGAVRQRDLGEAAPRVERARSMVALKHHSRRPAGRRCLAAAISAVPIPLPCTSGRTYRCSIMSPCSASKATGSQTRAVSESAKSGAVKLDGSVDRSVPAARRSLGGPVGPRCVVPLVACGGQRRRPRCNSVRALPGLLAAVLADGDGFALATVDDDLLGARQLAVGLVAADRPCLDPGGHDRFAAGHRSEDLQLARPA